MGLQQVQGRCPCETAREQGPAASSIQGLCIREGGRDTLVQRIRYPGAFWVMGHYSGTGDVISESHATER